MRIGLYEDARYAFRKTDDGDWECVSCPMIIKNGLICLDDDHSCPCCLNCVEDELKKTIERCNEKYKKKFVKLLAEFKLKGEEYKLKNTVNSL